MKNIKFVKYNKTRREAFQIKTCIVQEGEAVFVEKSPLFVEGASHLDSFEYKYEWLKKQHQGIGVLKPQRLLSEGVVRFPFVVGKTMAEELLEVFKTSCDLVFVIEQALNRVLQVREGLIKPFEKTDAFCAVFGEEAFEDSSFYYSNVDALFENIMDTEQGYVFIDYEWVFDFPIPVTFIKFRMLYYFYGACKVRVPFDSVEEFLAAFGISKKVYLICKKMEDHFQEYVHGENQQIYLLNYLKNTKTPQEVMGQSREIEELRENVCFLKSQIKAHEAALKKSQEVKRLTDNHVTNLEAVIGQLSQGNEAMSGELDYLRSHEALFFKMKRGLGNQIDLVLPKGSRKRKIVSYGKNTLLHPITYGKRYGTEAGRNLIEGDFKVGNAYLTHGKLCFPVYEAPKVSIIIPVYNQIHYTYACLASILLYTTEVSYEVIIADDVSTDATKELMRFTENIVICRNETNQGFLKNCNQAARSAKGEYVMFLNNDTQVTKGWLGALVDLIESDDTIGLVGSKLVYPDGRLQEAGGILWSDGSGWNYGRLDDPDKPEYNYVKDVDYISGAAILLSNELWKQIGGFDERFAPAYCEDSDLAFEVRKAGLRVVYQPLSRVIHFEGVSNGTDVNGSGLKRYQVENSKKLREKWSAEFEKQCENTGNPDPFRARERSMGKAMILVVDHYIPTFDKDAGSKTTYQYLKMFVKKGYVVKFLGDNFLREDPYATALEQMGIEILYGNEYQAGIWDWLKAHGDEIGYVYLNRPHIAGRYIDFIKNYTSMKVIYYGHDLHFLREGREFELTGNLEKKESAQYWKSVELSLMRKADMSYYPSYIERDAIRAIDSSIEVKDIVAYVYDEFLNVIPDDFSKREGLLFVGGFAHPPNEDAVLWFAKEIYPLIRETNPIPFYVVGSKVTEEIKALEKPGNGIIVKGFVSDEELAHLYEQCKVVVVPLRYGAGVKGKVIEALYYGLPIVTTSIGAEGIVGATELLAVADTAYVFAKEVVRLYEDEALLKQICEKAQIYMKEHFSMDGAWEVIEQDFRS